MNDRDRDDHGRYTRERSPARLLDAMKPGEPYTAGELAEETGWPRRTVHAVLSDLADEEKVRRKKTGPRTVIWMKP